MFSEKPNPMKVQVEPKVNRNRVPQIALSRHRRARVLTKGAMGLGLTVLLLSCTSPAVTSEPTPTPAVMGGGQALPITAQAQMAGQVIQLEVAQTPEQQQIGLMYRTALAADRGMLFPFNPPRPVQFWMKNVSIHLDMVFLRQGKVVAIAAAVPPCKTEPCPTYGPTATIDQVIELRGGRAQEIGLKVGDRVKVESRKSS
jgi:uncharacterized protein